MSVRIVFVMGSRGLQRKRERGKSIFLARCRCKWFAGGDGVGDGGRRMFAMRLNDIYKSDPL